MTAPVAVFGFVWVVVAVVVFGVSLSTYRDARKHIREDTSLSKTTTMRIYAKDYRQSARWMTLAWVWPLAIFWPVFTHGAGWSRALASDLREAWVVGFGKEDEE